MDFIFDDDSDDVGSDIEAYCPKCKADTAHTIITKYEDEIRRVQCSPCGDVHSYRKPRGEVEDEIVEPVAAKRRAMLKKPTWEEARAKLSEKALANARPYSIRDSYHEGDVVTHPKFGLGFVTEITENKVEITFQDERRLLVHNRPDLAAVMPAIAPLPPPRETTKGPKGKGKKSTAKAAEEAAQAAEAGKTSEEEAKKASGAKGGAKAPAPAARGGAARAQGKAERAKAAAAKKAAAQKGASPKASPKKPTAKSAAAKKPVKKPAVKAAVRRPARAATPVRSAAKKKAKGQR